MSRENSGVCSTRKAHRGWEQKITTESASWCHGNHIVVVRHWRASWLIHEGRVIAGRVSMKSFDRLDPNARLSRDRRRTKLARFSLIIAHLFAQAGIDTRPCNLGPSSRLCISDEFERKMCSVRCQLESILDRQIKKCTKPVHLGARCSF